MKQHKASFKRAPAAPAFFSPQVAEADRFYLDLNPPKRKQLTVVCGGLECCTPDFAIHRETFPFFSIEYVLRGRGELKLRGRTHVLEPGRVFSYGPGIPHHIEGNRADPLVKYFVDFSGLRAGELLRSCGLAQAGVAQVFPSNTLSPLFNELIQSGQNTGPGSAALCTKLLECLVLRLESANAPLQSAEKVAFTTYQKCRRHIEQHFLRLRTLHQIAGECRTNDAYLCRLFRRYDHQSPYQYLLRLKMNYAAARLQRPGALVKQVAEAVGFGDPFHFSRVFRNVLGLSPSAFGGLR